MTRRRPRALISALLMLGAGMVAPISVRAQAPEIRDELMRQFDVSMQKFVALARAMPAETYEWAPGEGVMQVGHVFMHVAHYNYLYPSGSMGVPAPVGVDMDAMESVRDKEQVVHALEQSHAWVTNAVSGMTADDLLQQTQLYGRDVRNWAVLVQLVAHMNEHLGQSIAYARMNDVVPPWSR